jgi:glutamate synthase domain-containing protein 3
MVLAELGIATLDEAIGRVGLLRPTERTGRLATLDFAALLAPPPAGKPIRFDPTWERGKHHTPLADYLLDRAGLALRGIGAMKIPASIRNRDRASGGELAGEMARRKAAVASGGMPPAPIDVRLTGSAGQSFGAFCVDDLTLRLRGEANDYVGKGMSGGLIVIQPTPGFATADAPLGSRPVLIGNTVLYGATGGELFVGGAAGERFAVRNSGATAVIEGVGDHGCEYMTGGTVLVLGATGRNFAAGMTAGRAFVLDEEGTFRGRCNRDTVLLSRVTRDSEEAATIKALLERHAELTGSARANTILAEWNHHAPLFWSVTGKPPVVAAPATQARPTRAPRAPIAVRRNPAAENLVPTGTGGGDD